MKVTFSDETPTSVRESILESLAWAGADNVTETAKALLSARMENLYFKGKLDGITECQAISIKAIKSIGRTK